VASDEWLSTTTRQWSFAGLSSAGTVLVTQNSDCATTRVDADPGCRVGLMILLLRRVFSRARCSNTPIRPRRCGLESGAALGYPPLLRFPAKNVVCSYPAQDQRIARDLVSDAIGDRNAGFPDVFYTLHFLIAQGGMARIFDQPAQSFFSPLLNVLRELLKVSFERVSAKNLQRIPLRVPRRLNTASVPGKSRGITTSGP
jgi:hypothetical protein